MVKTKELSRDKRDRIIERHKGGRGYRKISREMNIALSRVGNIIKKYNKYDNGTANLPRNGRQRKINERTSRWISRNVQINPFITRSEIKTDLEGVGINLSLGTISRALYRTGFHSISPRKVPLLKTKHVEDWFEFVETYEKKGMQFWGKVIWSDETKAELFRRNSATNVWRKKMALPSRSTISSPQLSLGVVPLWYGDAFHSRALVSYKLSMVEWMVACTGRF